jgi:hypothetical protein
MHWPIASALACNLSMMSATPSDSLALQWHETYTPVQFHGTAMTLQADMGAQWQLGPADNRHRLGQVHLLLH